MAKIPVEKESGGGGWWKWLIGLLLLIGLIWLLAEVFSGDEVEEPVVEEPVATETAAQGGVITDVSTLFAAEDRRALVGREVQLADMHVREVIGDSVFYISPEEDVAVEPGNQVVIAVLDEVIPASPPDVEGRYDVTEGQTLTVYGTVRAIEQQDPSAWGVTEQEAGEMLEQDQIYVRVQRLEITETAEASPEGAGAS